MWQEWFGHHFMSIHICFNFQERCPCWVLLKSFRKQKQRLCAQPEEDRALCIHHLYTLSQGFWAICGPGCFPLLPDVNSPASGAVDNLACAWSYEVRRKPELPAGSEQFLARDPPTSECCPVAGGAFLFSLASFQGHKLSGSGELVSLTGTFAEHSCSNRASWRLCFPPCSPDRFLYSESS